MIVLDASVLVKWFVEEEGLAEALRYRQRHVEGQDVVAIPDLAFYEIANAFVFQGRLSRVEIEESLTQLQDYQLEVGRFSELPGVVGIAQTYGLTIYDAAYVALAKVLRCRFVTADARLVNRLRGVPYVRPLASPT